MTTRRQSIDEPTMLSDLNPNRGAFNRQNSAREESPKFNNRRLNTQSTFLPHSKSGQLSVFEQNRKPLGSESVAFGMSKPGTLSIMNVSSQYLYTNCLVKQ